MNKRKNIFGTNMRDEVVVEPVQILRGVALAKKIFMPRTEGK